MALTRAGEQPPELPPVRLRVRLAASSAIHTAPTRANRARKWCRRMTFGALRRLRHAAHLG
jgi:hypothetical protein